jgi:hypothetical protein
MLAIHIEKESINKKRYQVSHCPAIEEEQNPKPDRNAFKNEAEYPTEMSL